MTERSNENVIEWIDGQQEATITYSSRYANKIRKLADKAPDEVKIVAENRDGSILAKVPLSWVAVRPKEKHELTEEQRAKMSERMKVLLTKQAENRAKQVQTVNCTPEA